MKIALILFVIGLIVGLVIPYYIREIYAGAGIQFPNFFRPKSPPHVFQFSVPVVLRVLAGILVVLAFVRLVLTKSGPG
jgi:hypothetical protein